MRGDEILKKNCAMDNASIEREARESRVYRYRIV